MKIRKIIAAAAALMLTGCASETTATADVSETAAVSSAAVSEAVSETSSHTEISETEAEISIPEDTSALREETENAYTEAETAVPTGSADAKAADAAAGMEMIMPYLSGTAEGDIISISIGESYMDCSVKYGNLKLLEEESTSSTLYFQAICPGKDNIIISENSNDGIILRQYVAEIADDLTVKLYTENGGNDIMPLM